MHKTTVHSDVFLLEFIHCGSISTFNDETFQISRNFNRIYFLKKDNLENDFSTVLQIRENPKINAPGVLKCSTERGRNFVHKSEIS